MIKDEAEIEEFYKNDKKMAEEKIKLFHFSEWYRTKIGNSIYF